MATESEKPSEGWYWTLQEAANVVLAEDRVELNSTHELVFLARKRNPIHEFSAELRRPRED